MFCLIKNYMWKQLNVQNKSMSMKYFVFIIAQKKIIAAYIVKISVHNGTNQVTYIADIQLNQKK